MATEAPPAQNKDVKVDVPATTTTENVVNTQVESSSEQPKNPVEEEVAKKAEDSNNKADTNNETTDTTNSPSSPTTEDTSKSANAKLRAMFNTFSKGSKKESVTEETPAEHTESKTGSSHPHSENKLSKGFGSLFSRVMPTTSKEHETKADNSKDENADTQPAVEINENVPAAATTEPDVTHEETPPSGDHVAHTKRQSLLGKLFGAGKKKEDEHVEKEHEHEETEPNTEREVENVAVQETRSSSPPLGRRLTGFFSKKMPKLDKKKASDKLETSDHEADEGTKEVGRTAVVDKELPQQPTEETVEIPPEEATEGLQANTLASNTPAIIAK